MANATLIGSSSSGGVTSVSGTAGFITSTGGTTPVIDIDPTYVGQTSITTLGTVSTGLIDAVAGGTGVSSPTAHGIMIAEGASAMTPIVLTAGQVLIGTTSSDPVGATLTAGTNISITSATGAITINSTASGGGNWVKIATGSLGSNSITFSSLTSAYKTYKVILSGVKLSGADYIVGQLNGVANVYSYGAIKMDSNVTPTVTPAYLSGNGQMTFFGVSAVDASTLHISEITISELNSYQATSTLSDPTNGRVVMYQIGGYAAPLGPISSINLYTYGGSVTFTSGSVILYGLN